MKGGETMKKPRLFQLNGQEVVIAMSKEEAQRWYNEEYGAFIDEWEAEPVRSYQKKHWWIFVSDTELRKILEKFGTVKVGIYMDEPAAWLSYAQSLELYEYDGPTIFSSTEW